MTRTSLITRMLVLALILAAGTLGLAGCDGGDGEEDATDTADHDVTIDDVRIDQDVIDPPIEDVIGEPSEDVQIDDAAETEPLPCPAGCQTAPAAGDMGGACTTTADCDHGATCYTQRLASYGGNDYTSFYGGACILYGAGTTGCDPLVTTTCPEGSQCIFMFTDMGSDYYGCWDSCTPVDTTNNPYTYNCGCREGYECSITGNVCFPGCSNNAECCERWWDLNGDFLRSADEVVTKEGCTNTCADGGLFSGTNPGLCAATFGCINNGDTTKQWGDPCEGDAWCPQDGRCWDPFNYTLDSGDPIWPGGYCLKDACNYVGRGCTDDGGYCANWGTAEDPFYFCAPGCHFGRLITDETYECRTTAGEEQKCMPWDTWFGTGPTDGSDGICWPGNFPGGTGVLAAPCTYDSDCASPAGLGTGFCAQYTPPSDPYCSINCASAFAGVCGGDDGTGKATGGCAYNSCWKGCSGTTGPIADNGCDNPSLACYLLSEIGITAAELSVEAGLTKPTAICWIKCVDNTWCTTYWQPGTTCDTTTGKCGV